MFENSPLSYQLSYQFFYSSNLKLLAHYTEVSFLRTLFSLLLNYPCSSLRILIAFHDFLETAILIIIDFL